VVSCPEPSRVNPAAGLRRAKIRARIGISTLIAQFQTFWGQMTAVAAIHILPVLILTLITQRGLIRGMMSGATKG
jgi:ABC-type glycerol-3-phosphate transport system permease component